MNFANKIKQLNFSKKYFLFYFFLLIYFIFGCVTIYHYILKYKYFQNQPKQLSNLYIFYGDYLFLKPILITLVTNFILAFYLMKNFSKDIILKYVSIILGISIILGFAAKFGVFHDVSLPFIMGMIIYFLFFSNFAIQNFTILAFSFLLLFPLKINVLKRSKLEKSIITTLVIVINFILIAFRFPQYWIGPAASINYF